MKVIIELDSNDEETSEREVVQAHVHAKLLQNYELFIDDIWNKLFRPINKHGYGNKRIDEENEAVYEAVDELVEMYLRLKEEYMSLADGIDENYGEY